MNNSVFNKNCPADLRFRLLRLLAPVLLIAGLLFSMRAGLLPAAWRGQAAPDAKVTAAEPAH